MQKLAILIALVGCGDNDDGELLGPPMDPMGIPKFVQPLSIPPVMPMASDGEYRIAVRQFEQRVLPEPMPLSTVWGYGSVEDDATFSYPAHTIETRSESPVRVVWINELVDVDGRFLPHLMPVDQTIHWADPGGTGHDDHGARVQPYTGPVPIVTHVHGAHSFDHSDGHPEAWMLPAANDIPEGFAERGPMFRTQADAAPPGEARFDYPLDENAATLWYHDHSLGMTRVNVYAGLAGFWLIRDAAEDAMDLPGPAPRLGDPPGTRYYEIPLVIQDKTFGEDGQLWYPSSRSDYDDYDGPTIPDSDVPPIWGPEFIGNAIVVNGRAWPFLEVEPRLYRFRILNASDARTFFFALDRAGIELIHIGGDGGFRPDGPVRTDSLRVGAAERMDVLVDFSNLAPGDVVTMLNTGPDEPWGGPDAGQAAANPDTTGQILQFRVVELTTDGTRGSVPTALPAIPPLEPTVPPRDLMLAEIDHEPGSFPVHILLGTVADGPLAWDAPATEVIREGDTEMWRVANTTDDAHPIHLHLIEFQVVDRIPFDADGFSTAQAAYLADTGPLPVLDDFITGPALPPDPSDLGPKDTVLMLPGTITRLVARFDRAGSYVWHCHIIEHEDNEMMRPMEISPREAVAR